VRRWLIGIGVVALAAGAAVSVFAVRNALYAGKALPGVTVHRLALAKPVTVVAAGRRFRVAPAALLRYDAAATRRAALGANRGSFWHHAGSLLSPSGWKREVPAVYRLRRRGLARLFTGLDDLGRSSADAKVTLHGLEPVVTRARYGTRVARNALLASLLAGDRRIVAGYRPSTPSFTTAEAQEAARRARAVLATPVALTFRGRQLGELAPARLARAIAFSPQLGFDEPKLARLLQPYVRQWRRRAVNARFLVRGKLVAVAPSHDGFDVDARTAAGELLEASGSIEIPMHAVPADITTAEANALGIKRQLVSFTTQMGASSSNRIHNVHLMADFIDGTVIKPGQVFSFNQVVGPRTAERGFLEGQEIIGSLVLPSIGGGVCQTATTLFNDAFETGLPVLERHNHNLYLSHYPVGRDATVSWGGPDLKFRNDLEHAILIKSSYTDSTLTFSFYGTPQGRRVVSTTGPKVNWRGPRMSYAVDPSAPYGSVKVVSGSGEMGFDVTVQRTVYAHGKVLRRDHFVSTYIPDSPTTVYGPGRRPPGPYFVLPSRA
jgi:vancomycin resistance protein YoaR